MTPHKWQSICPPGEGEATTFTLMIDGQQEDAFIVRTNGALHAYINRCPHAGTTLDWLPGRFFCADGIALVCQTHGAMFAAAGGARLSGPCDSGLTPLPTREHDGQVQVPDSISHIDIAKTGTPGT
ncbi:MAG: Rieske 2Fe-2S domain-containing protein [Mariprofundaceae bacterium]|nr:Rieske 2Fe-2S domain-containing protein [Mariprofundaceae bacterium]